ncbi:MAG: O-phosphoserine--tRNA ligase [Candidatus Altiarchaeota archaeon]
MKLTPSAIKAQSHADYRKAWIETAKLIPPERKEIPPGQGKPHIMHELTAKVRQVFLQLGFSETENQIFIPEEDVYKQYGPEAPVILDRCFYLGGLTRPDIGISQEKMAEVGKVAQVEPEKLKQLFRQYREGKIEGDDVIETMVKWLKLTTDEASRILNMFPEFKDITPVCGKTTLRSHMTAAWFPTLQAMQDDVPLRLFSVGLRFRREQKIDASHLRAHYGGSMVVMDEDISLKTGMELTRKILNSLEFGDITFEKKKATSNYYAPDTEYEVYSSGIEVADIGMYSPVALAEYDLEYNVFNLGFGMERILMVKNKISDVRQVLYPQFYSITKLTDQELKDHVKIAREPATEEGKNLATELKKAYLENGQKPSPCSFKAYEGPLKGKNILVNVLEKEEKTTLLGPAAANDLYVHDGGIYGLPKDTSKLKQDMSHIIQKGIPLHFNFLDAITSGIASEIEEKIESGEKEGLIQYKMAKGPADVNIKITNKARRCIESQNKQISIKGPVFTAAEFKVL